MEMENDFDECSKLLILGTETLCENAEKGIYFIFKEKVVDNETGSFLHQEIVPIKKSYLAIWLSRRFGLEEYLKIEG